MTKQVIVALRTGGDFHARHVQALHRQLTKWAPTARLTCLSNVDVPGVDCVALKYNWPDWWVKMEMFRPDIAGDFLCTDLDNVFLGPLQDILAVDKYTTQSGESNALAFYPKAVRDMVWAEWIKDPEGHMYRFHPSRSVVRNSFGDGGYVKSLIHAEQHWEELLPGQVVNIATTMVSVKTPPNSPWTPRRRWPLKPIDLPKDMRVLLCARPHRPWLLPVLRPYNLY